ncbi:MAG: MFS transporter, partial [Dehalococcoidia bacterium]
ASAISLHASGSRSVALAASIVGGLLLEALGPGPVFLLAALASALGAAVYSTLRVAPAAHRRPGARLSLWGDAIEGLRVALRIPVVLTLLLLALAIEVFAFSYQSLMPALADRVLEVDAAGLGLLTFGASLGAVLGMVALSQLVEVVPRGWLLVVVTTVFAVGLLALAVSDHFMLSLGLMVVIGSMAAMFDALQWALLQASVPDEVRGRVIGLWMMAIGFGWLGPVILGGAAEGLGTRWGIAIGGAVALLVAGTAVASPRLRRL